jgi:hypothetical protein
MPPLATGEPMTDKPKKKDPDLSKAKKKLATLIEATDDVDKVVSLANALSKLVAVELKMTEEDWGEALGGKKK